MLPNVKESAHIKPEPIGVGYLHHCIPAHQKYFQRLWELGAPLDMMEYLAAHFAYDPGYLGEINDFTAGLPSTLHSYEYMLGSVERPPADVVDRLQHMARVSHCRWIGEHIGMVGTADTYSGTFLQPLGTDEQTYAVGYVVQGAAWAGMFLSGNAMVAVIVLALMRLASGLIIALDTTILLAAVPAGLRGRVTSLHMTTYSAMARVSLALSGVLLTVTDIRPLGVVAGLCSVLVGLVWWGLRDRTAQSRYLAVTTGAAAN